MKKLLLTVIFIGLISVCYGFTWTHYADVSVTSATNPISVSSAAVGAVIYDGNLYIMGTGSTFTAAADNSMYIVPMDLSAMATEKPAKVPYPAGKFGKLFNYGNRLYYFPGRDHLVDGGRSRGEVYSAVIFGSYVGGFTKIADIPYYSTHPLSNYVIAHDEDNNAFYIIGGQCWPNTYNIENFYGKVSNNELLYTGGFNDRYERIGSLGAYDMGMAGKLDTNGEFIDFAVAITSSAQCMGTGYTIDAVDDGYIVIAGRCSSLSSVDKGYHVVKLDKYGNVVSRRTEETTGNTVINDSVVYSNNVYLSGYYDSSAIVTKLDDAGIEQWSTTVGGADFTGLTAITAEGNTIIAVGESWGRVFIGLFDVNGNTTNYRQVNYVVGDLDVATCVTTTSNTIFFGVDSNSVGVVSYDMDLNFQWSYTVPGWSTINSLHLKDDNTVVAVKGTEWVEVDFSGNCVLAKSLEYSLNGKVSMDTDGNLYFFNSNGTVLKTDSAGNSLWTFSRNLENASSPSNNISYLKFSAGTLVDSWSTTVNFRVFDGYASVYDNYLYVMGGNIQDAMSIDNTWSVPLNADGTLQMPFTAQTTMPLKGGRGSITRIGDTVYIVSGVDPVGATSEFSTTLSSGTIGTWTYTTNFPFVQRYTSLVNDGLNLYAVGGWSNTAGSEAQYPLDDIYVVNGIVETATPTCTPTITPTVSGSPPTQTYTATPRNTSTYTTTVSPSITRTHTTVTITPTATRTPHIVYYRTSQTIIQGSTYMNTTYGAKTVDLTSYWTWFSDGYSVFAHRDNVQADTYMVIEKQDSLMNFKIKIINRTTGLAVDTSSDPTWIQFTAIREP